MINAILAVILMGAASAALSVTVSKSHVFSWVRVQVALRSEVLGQLLSCPWCCSHWFAALIVTIAPWWLVQDPGLGGYVILWLATVTVSGILANVITKG